MSATPSSSTLFFPIGGIAILGSALFALKYIIDFSGSPTASISSPETPKGLLIPAPNKPVASKSKLILKSKSALTSDPD